MCDTRTLFARKGLRCTRQRQTIYEALAGAGSHPTAEELFWLARAADPALGLSLATVYNALEAFCRHDLCRRLPHTAGPSARFDADLHEHLHIVTADGRVLDVPDDLGARLVASVSREVLAELERRTGVPLANVRIGLLAQGPEAPPITGP